MADPPDIINSGGFLQTNPPPADSEINTNPLAPSIETTAPIENIEDPEVVFNIPDNVINTGIPDISASSSSSSSSSSSGEIVTTIGGPPNTAKEWGEVKDEWINKYNDLEEKEKITYAQWEAISLDTQAYLAASPEGKQNIEQEKTRLRNELTQMMEDKHVIIERILEADDKIKTIEEIEMKEKALINTEDLGTNKTAADQALVDGVLATEDTLAFMTKSQQKEEEGTPMSDIPKVSTRSKSRQRRLEAEMRQEELEKERNKRRATFSPFTPRITLTRPPPGIMPGSEASYSEMSGGDASFSFLPYIATYNAPLSDKRTESLNNPYNKTFGEKKIMTAISRSNSRGGAPIPSSALKPGKKIKKRKKKMMMRMKKSHKKCAKCAKSSKRKCKCH